MAMKKVKGAKIVKKLLLFFCLILLIGGCDGKRGRDGRNGVDGLVGPSGVDGLVGPSGEYDYDRDQGLYYKGNSNLPLNPTIPEVAHAYKHAKDRGEFRDYLKVVPAFHITAKVASASPSSLMIIMESGGLKYTIVLEIINKSHKVFTNATYEFVFKVTGMLSAVVVKGTLIDIE